MKNNNIRYSVIVHMIRTITVTILSFISFPFACRALGDAGMGTYTWANTFVYYFLTLAKLGIPTIAIRECTKVRDDKEALSHKAQEFFLLQAILTLLSFGLMVTIMVASQGELWKNRALIFLLSTNFLVGAFSFEWIYIALEKHYYTAFRSILALATSALLILLYIKLPENGIVRPFEEQIYLYAFFACMTTYITVFLNLFFLHRHISFKKTRPYQLKSYIKPLVVVFGLSIVLTLYNQNDSFILGLMDPTKKEVGSYSVGIKAIEVVITLITSLSAVFIPRATYYYQMENKVFFHNLTRYSMNICCFIALPAIATLTTLSHSVTGLISGANGYENAATTLIILASMTLTYSISDMIYNSILIPMGKEKIYLYTMSGGMLSNLLLSVILAKVFSSSPSIGIALATSITDFIILFVLIYLTREYSFKAIFNKNNLKILVSATVVAVISYFANRYLSVFNYSYFERIIIILLFDAFIYVGLLLILNENLVCSFIRHKKEAELTK